jgi:hypothetical protein
MSQEFFTGATVVKSATAYEIVYKNTTVAEYALYESAIICAMDRTALEQLLKNKQLQPD